MEYYQVGNKKYYLNLENLFALVTETPNGEKNIHTSITEYLGNLEENNGGKEIVESRSTLNETMNNVRYDLLKNLIACVMSIEFNITHLQEVNFAQGLCLNTLIEYKILSEVENNEFE